MNLDSWLLELLHETLAHPVLDGIMIVATGLLPAVVVVTAVHDLRRGQRRAALVALGAALLALIVAVELQFVLIRARPSIVRWVIGPVGVPSYPSGHAAVLGAWAILTALRSTAKVAVGAVGTALLVGVSRVYLAHHYPSDVVVGFVIGGAIGALFYGAFHSKEGRPRWSWWLWPQFAVVVFATVGAYLQLYDFAVLRLPYADKVLHFVLFGALAFFLVGFLHRIRAAWVLGTLAVLATLDELLQMFSPARTFDGVDLICTLAGIAVLGVAGACFRNVARVPDAEGRRPDTPAPTADEPWRVRAA